MTNGVEFKNMEQEKAIIENTTFISHGTTQLKSIDSNGLIFRSYFYKGHTVNHV